MLVGSSVLEHVKYDVAHSRRTFADGQQEKEEISLLHLRLCSLSLMKTDFCQAWRGFHQAEGGDWSLNTVMASGTSLPQPRPETLADSDPPSLRVSAKSSKSKSSARQAMVWQSKTQCCGRPSLSLSMLVHTLHLRVPHTTLKSPHY